MSNLVGYGIEKIELADIVAATGLPDAFAEVGRVLKDSGGLETTEGEVIEHFAELEEDPVVVINRKGQKTFRFTLMELAADTLVTLFGGTVTAVLDTPDLWNEPRGIVTIEKSLRLTLDSGHVITINRGKIHAKFIGQLTKNGLFNAEIMVRQLTPLVADVPPLTISDNVTP